MKCQLRDWNVSCRAVLPVEAVWGNGLYYQLWGTSLRLLQSSVTSGSFLAMGNGSGLCQLIETS
jgi:hypothetical protein